MMENFKFIYMFGKCNIDLTVLKYHTAH